MGVALLVTDHGEVLTAVANNERSVIIMKLETRIITEFSRNISIREVEDIYEDDRNAAINEYLSELGRPSEDDYFSLRGGILG